MSDSRKYYVVLNVSVGKAKGRVPFGPFLSRAAVRTFLERFGCAAADVDRYCRAVPLKRYYEKRGKNAETSAD